MWYFLYYVVVLIPHRQYVKLFFKKLWLIWILYNHLCIIKWKIKRILGMWRVILIEWAQTWANKLCKGIKKFFPNADFYPNFSYMLYIWNKRTSENVALSFSYPHFYWVLSFSLIHYNLVCFFFQWTLFYEGWNRRTFMGNYFVYVWCKYCIH